MPDSLPEPDDAPAFTTAQAAARLGVATNSVMNWVDTGLLQAWRTPGGHRRISGASVDAMLAERRRGAEMAQKRGRSVVVVEDDADTGAVLVAQMAQILPDARIRLVTDGFQGLLEAGRELPDLMLSDVDLPGMNGLAMVHSLRMTPVARQMAFVLVSNYSLQELGRFGERPADVPFVNKPVTNEALRAAVYQALGASAIASP